MSGESSFERDSYTFLPLSTRRGDELEEILLRLLGGVDEAWGTIAERIERLRTLSDVATMPSEILEHVFPLVAMGDLPAIWNALGNDDRRRLLLAAAPMWKRQGTEAALAIVARFFTGRPFLYRDAHNFLPVLPWTFGVSYGGAALWHPSYAPGLGSIDSVHLHLVDEGLDRTLLRELAGVIRPLDLRVVIALALFIEDWSDPELGMWDEIPGTTAGIAVEDRRLEIGPGGQGGLIADFSTLPWDDFLVTTHIRQEDPEPLASEASYSAIFFRAESGSSLYVLRLYAYPDPAGSSPPWGGSGNWQGWALFSLASGLIGAGAFPLIPDYDHHVAVHCIEVATGTRLKIALDGTQVLNAVDTAGDRPVSGTAGIGHDSSTTHKTIASVFEVLPQPPEILLAGPRLRLDPSHAGVNPSGTVEFTAAGAGGEFFFDFVTNESGGTITPLSDTQALYIAGGSTGRDVVRAFDDFGNEATSEIVVDV